VNRINDRIDALSRVQADSAQDLVEQVKLVEIKTNQDLQEYARHNVKVRASVETNDLEVRARCQRLEDKQCGLENRIQEFMNRQSIQYEDLRSSKEKLTQTMEQIRLEDRSRGLSMRSVMSRVGELEDRTQKHVDESMSQAFARSFDDNISGRSTCTSPKRIGPGGIADTGTMQAQSVQSAPSQDRRATSPSAPIVEVVGFGSISATTPTTTAQAALSSEGSISLMPSMSRSADSRSMTRCTSPSVRLPGQATPTSSLSVPMATAPPLTVQRVFGGSGAVPAGSPVRSRSGPVLTVAPAMTMAGPAVLHGHTKSPPRDGRLSPSMPLAGPFTYSTG